MPKIVRSDTIPDTYGHIILVYEYKGELWSNTCLNIRGTLYPYNSETDAFDEPIDLCKDCKILGYLYSPDN